MTPDALVNAAYSPELFAALGQSLSRQLADYLTAKHRREGSVLPWRDPGENIAAAKRWLDQPPSSNSAEIAERWDQLVQTMLGAAQNLHHPRYIGHQVPAPVPVAGWLEAVGSVTNQPMAIYEMGPWSTAVERALVAALGERLGFPPETFAGLVTHGGSLANLTALLTARNVALGDFWERGMRPGGAAPRLLVSADAHYSLVRAAGILGIGTDNVFKVALDERRRMSPKALRTALEQARRDDRPVIAVVASSGTTAIGAFDPLPKIADLCAEFGVWLHVDAAHGGAACFSPRYRHLVNGIERADSVVWDAHKMLFVPALCAFVFYKNRDHRFEAFRQHAPYLFDPTAPELAEFDVGRQTIECTKRAAGLGLWGVWSLFGPELLTTLIETTFDLGPAFYQLLQAADDFDPIHEPQANIVAFRHVPPAWRSLSPTALGDRQLQLRRSLIESGEFYITSTTIDGIGALRVTIMNPLTTLDDLRGLMDALRSHAARLSNS